MTVYIVIDDCPPSLGEIKIISVHHTAIGALARIKHLQKEDEYINQYLRFEKFKLEG